MCGRESRKESYYLNIYRNGFSIPFMGFGAAFYRTSVRLIGGYYDPNSGHICIGFWFSVLVSPMRINREAWKKSCR